MLTPTNPVLTPFFFCEMVGVLIFIFFMLKDVNIFNSFSSHFTKSKYNIYTLMRKISPYLLLIVAL